VPSPRVVTRHPAFANYQDRDLRSPRGLPRSLTGKRHDGRTQEDRLRQDRVDPSSNPVPVSNHSLVPVKFNFLDGWRSARKP
jgi:hypothetical protein